MIHIRKIRSSPFGEENIWMKQHVTPEEAKEVCFSDPRAPVEESQLGRLWTNRGRTESDGLPLPGGRWGFSSGEGPRHGAVRTAPLPAE